ncbi:hypothetical protein FRC17_010548 [Serendipita sp. 399]|nr:hypothetical protein FRC17_010548 [Serendipita sp. 399]
MSMVFVAGPLSGLFVQPLIGVYADKSTSRWGRRRPYMFYGSILCSLSLLLLGFTKEVVSWFISPDSSANATVTIWLAVIAIYCIDFSINAVQAVDRALLVDILPTGQQERGQAWAGRMLSVGSVVGFWVGHLSLPVHFPFLGKTQLQVLCVLTSLLLIGSHLITALSVKERVLLPAGLHQDIASTESGTRRGWRHFAIAKTTENKTGTNSAFKDIWANVKTLPPNIRRICMIQFFSWIGWFPVLFFSTVYVGEVYTLSLPPSQVNSSTPDDATLVGASALFNSSILGLGTIIFLPLLVGYFKKRSPRRIGFYLGLAEIWIFSLLLFAGCMGATWFTSSSVTGSVNVIALTGFCFAVSQWIPFSLLAEQISGQGGNDATGYQPLTMDGGNDEESIPMRQPNDRMTQESGPAAGVVFDSGEESAARADADERTLVEDEERARLMEREREGREQEERQLMKDLEASEFAVESSPYAGGSSASGSSAANAGGVENQKQSNISEKAGIILGIHNVSIVIPQFLVTALSSIIFAIYEPVSGVHPGAGHAGAGVGGGAAVGPAAVGDDSSLPVDLNDRSEAGRLLVRALSSVLKRLPGEPDDNSGSSSPDGIALIFKIGGFSSVIAAFLCWRLAKELRRRRGF